MRGKCQVSGGRKRRIGALRRVECERCSGDQKENRGKLEEQAGFVSKGGGYNFASKESVNKAKHASTASMPCAVVFVRRMGLLLLFYS